MKRTTTPPSVQKTRAQRRAQARLKKRGLNPPLKPEGEIPEVPLDLADLSDDDLMEALREHSEWASHLGQELAVAEIVEEAAQDIYESLRTRHMIALEPASRNETMTERRARAEILDDVAEAKDEWRSSRAYRKLVANIAEAAERRASNISREITRRVGRDGPDRRSTRWTP